MNDEAMNQGSAKADLLFVPPVIWKPMDLSALKTGGIRRALNGAGMLWLTCVWVGLIVFAAVAPEQMSDEPMPPFWAMLALFLLLILWQLFGLWRICSVPPEQAGGKRQLLPKILIQSVACGLGLPLLLVGVIVVIVKIAAS